MLQRVLSRASPRSCKPLYKHTVVGRDRCGRSVAQAAMDITHLYVAAVDRIGAHAGSPRLTGGSGNSWPRTAGRRPRPWP